MLFLSSILLLFLTKRAEGCQIKTADGTFDLSKIAGKSYSFSSLGDYFAFSFCDNVADVSRCMSPVSGSCGVQDHGSDCYSLGTWDNSYEATSTNNSLKIMFANGSPDGCEEKNVPFPRSITFNFECDENEEASIESVGETLTCYYKANVGTKYVCSDHIIHSSSSGGGLSDGSIFLICLLVIVVVYCIGGFGFNKYKSSAGGLEAFPQASFWCTQLPLWVKTGCMVSWAFTVRLFDRIRAKITGVNPVNRGREGTDADGDYENLD